MKAIKERSTYALAAAAAIILASGAPAAIIVSDAANSEADLGQFTGEIFYFAASPNAGTLTITLTNTSAPGNGGFITGFVFNVDSADPEALATLTSASHAFSGLSNHGAPPYGTFTAGAALDGNWTGGGSPAAGIGVEQTGTFVFDVLAFDAPSLQTASFMSGPNDFNFVVRFRGFEDGGSDKVPAALIPGPATLGLLAVGLLVGRGRGRSRGECG